MRMKLFIACLLVMTSTLLLSCSQKSNGDKPENALDPDAINNPATASENNGEAESMLPVFQFTEEEFDFGSIKEGESVSHAFKFKNTGKSDLLISSASGSCGCTVPEWPKDPIAPGKEGTVNVRFNSEGKSGMQHKTVTLIANTIPNSKVLTITGEVVKK
jgi:Protein of unknown function (DUF1573)